MLVRYLFNLNINIYALYENNNCHLKNSLCVVTVVLLLINISYNEQ